MLHGHVDSLSPASGLEFALLPPDNATGNFTKIVQRVPVKIAFDDKAMACCAPACRPSRRSTPAHRRHGSAHQSIAAALPTSSTEAHAMPCQPARWRRPVSSAAKTWIAVVAATLGAFMAILNIQIVNASLADIQGAIGAGIDDGGWISTSYLVAEIIVIPLTGWLARVFSSAST